MKNILLAAAIAIMLPSNALAWGWLEIVKGIAGGIIGQINTSQTKEVVVTQAKADKTAKAAAPSEPLSPDAVLAALDQLSTQCQNISAQGFPCAIGTGRAKRPEDARKMASSRSIMELGKSMNSFVEGNAQDILKVANDEDLTTEGGYEEAMKLSVNAQVNGSQTYLTYTYVDEIDGKKEYVVTMLRVFNPALFETAIGEAAEGKPLSQQILDETKKGILSKFRDAFKSKKKK
uniref:Uncharacterized protein n=1 Tax=uncultured bacterium contig00070 TaxID=1181551 RepID=A0A806KN78_9BACT|nr:hypothetical protein [uncultured bacterium contig00070]